MPQLGFRAVWFQSRQLNQYVMLPPMDAYAPRIWAILKCPLVFKMWFEKFVFFKGRRQNKGRLPVDIDDMHAFLGVSTGLLCFLLWVLQCFIQITEKWLSSLSEPHFFLLWLFEGLTGNSSCWFSIWFSLPLSNLRLWKHDPETRKWSAKCGLILGELPIISRGKNRKLLWISLLDRLIALPLCLWISPIVKMP